MGSVPVGSPPRRESVMGAAGNGGQRLALTPGMGLAVAIAAGNYDKPGQGQLPMKVFREFVLAGIG
jgi:hypothetical protein